MTQAPIPRLTGLALFLGMAVLTAIVYWPGLAGAWLFDDYPNIVDNKGLHAVDASLPSLVRAALSSPSSEFKRPLASLSFAVNYLVSGLDPYWMKLTNLVLHLLNGALVFVLTRRLLLEARHIESRPQKHVAGLIAALVAGSWLLLPINLTAVLYVVQRMESLANLFVLIGLIGYLAGRRRMLGPSGAYGQGIALCIASLTLPTALGLLAKETAIMLPLYAAAAEWVLFGFQSSKGKRDPWVVAAFLCLLLLPLIGGLVWLLPQVLRPEDWATRSFTLSTRLLSEARIVASYVRWILLPTPSTLSFYHDDFKLSTGLLSPWTTLLSLGFLLGLAGLAIALRRRQPLASLGLFLYLGCHLLTGTILPLELIYEHRSYFASFGLMLAVVPPLVALPLGGHEPSFRFARRVLLGGLLLVWTALTAQTATAWGNPLHLAEELAARAPQSPRAQYELGRTYIIYSHYDPASPFTKLAYAPLERAAAMPESSILPQQALIFMNARMGLPTKERWWESMIDKLRERRPGVQDESSLGALAQCAREGQCKLPPQRMVEAFLAALSHPDPSARLLAAYSDYAWNILGDHALGLKLGEDAVLTQPSEPAYRITLVRMLLALGRTKEALQEYRELEHLNIGGSLDRDLLSLHQAIDSIDHSRSAEDTNG